MLKELAQKKDEAGLAAAPGSAAVVAAVQAEIAVLRTENSELKDEIRMMKAETRAMEVGENIKTLVLETYIVIVLCLSNHVLHV